MTTCTHGQLQRSCELCEKDARIAELERAFKKYAKHKNDSENFCDLLRHSHNECTCGLDQFRLRCFL